MAVFVIINQTYQVLQVLKKKFVWSRDVFEFAFCKILCCVNHYMRCTAKFIPQQYDIYVSMLVTVIYMFMPNLFLMFANRLLAFQDGLKFQQNLNSIPVHNFQKLELLQSYT